MTTRSKASPSRGGRILAALSGKPVVEGGEAAIYKGIRDHKAAIDFTQQHGRSLANQRELRGLVTVQLLRKLHELLTPKDQSTGSPYRNGNAPHRT